MDQPLQQQSKDPTRRRSDFSFSACLATAFGCATNMVATSLHTQDTLKTKHWTSKAHLELLKRKGCMVLHEVDVHDMNQHPTLCNMKFDVIIFNFPHAGHYLHLCERDDELIEMHKELVKGFFMSAREMVNEDGEVHVTHRDDFPYNKWKLKRLAKKSGLILKEKVEFKKVDYPGYHNKRGGEIKSNKPFPLNNQCFTFKFSLNGSGGDRKSKIDGCCDGVTLAFEVKGVYKQ
ncbi:hypothetical protein JRO89_XS15G0185900 [Xanthoceras sorbifolium]|uniref:25S rRNA (uridine-N(3))-methyltransferase BMT5-like domain-containing protein n=1 Tax=Xanthoceras sorbifolium TaxID=99658 RepID=A0ABQ8H2Z9_9ROSI|nr:hypothetical protein JRO89_XS15G0185900 [Xanthoceras sorbifolium]